MVQTLVESYMVHKEIEYENGIPAGQISENLRNLL